MTFSSIRKPAIFAVLLALCAGDLDVATVGKDANPQPAGIDLINNSASFKSLSFNLLCRDANNSKDVPRYKPKLGNKRRSEVTQLNHNACDLTPSFFDLKLHLSDRNFHSLNESDRVQPRQPNGELPVVPLMKLEVGNGAIERAVAAGLSFKGKAPDLGAFESRA